MTNDTMNAICPCCKKTGRMVQDHQGIIGWCDKGCGTVWPISDQTAPHQSPASFTKLQAPYAAMLRIA